MIEEYYYIDEIENAREFIRNNKNSDIIVCYDWNYLYKDIGNKSCGHVSIIDDLQDSQIVIVDSYSKNEFEVVDFEKLIEAIKIHGRQKRAGFGLIKNK